MTVDKSKLQNSPFGAIVTNTVTLRHTFNTTQNWTVPNTVNGIWVHLAGGGTGGSSKQTTGQTGGGQGGSGGNGVFGYTPVIPGSTVGITIGAGGAGGIITNDVVGKAGGITLVNTSGTCWVAGGGLSPQSQNGTNGFNQVGFNGKLHGVSRQQIVFSDRANSGRITPLFGLKEGVGFGGCQDGWDYNASNFSSQREGKSSIYGGGSGGGSVTNSVNGGNGQAGGAQNSTGNTGGAGAAFVNTNSGGGGGGAGIAGNGGAASGRDGGVGGAGGGGGGGAGAANANTGCVPGTGGAGAVLIYY
jgi:hypothetical protein